MGGLSPALHRPICPGPPCRNLTKYWRRQNIGTLQDFAKIQLSISLLTGVLSKSGKSKKQSPSLSDFSFSTLDLLPEAVTKILRPSFKHHIDILCTKLSKSMYCLNRVKNFVDKPSLLKLYLYRTSGVLFFIDYCTALRDT